MGTNSPTPLTFVTQALLDRIDTLEQSGTGGSSVTVDTELSDTSENPVQNKVVWGELQKMTMFGSSEHYIYGNGVSLRSASDADDGQCNVSFYVYEGHPAVEIVTPAGNTFEGKIATYSDVEDLTERIEALENAPSTGASAHGINPDGSVSHTATQTYDETSGYTYTKDVTATENGYISCQASQTHETEGNNKIILTCSINGTVIHKDCANGYGDMASILIPVAKGQTVNVQATSTVPATVEIKFMPLNS